MHNIYINNILYVVSTITCIAVSASSSGTYPSTLLKLQKLLRLETQ